MAVPSSPFEPIPRYLSQAEVGRFFAVISDPRDRALCATVYLYGLRVSEVRLLLRRDVDLDRGRITVKRVKRGYWSERPLFTAASDLLAACLSPLPPPDAGLRGPRRRVRKRQIEPSSFGTVTPPDFRTSAATVSAIRSPRISSTPGSPLIRQDHLGHRNIRDLDLRPHADQRRGWSSRSSKPPRGS